MRKRLERNDILLAALGLLLYVPAVAKYGYKLEVLLAVSLVIGFGVEFVAARLTRRTPDRFGYVAWILLPLVFPPALPLGMAAVSILFCLVVSVAFFGGYGRHPVAPVAVGWAFARLSFPNTFGFAWSLPFPGFGMGFRTWTAAMPVVDHPLQYLAANGGTTLVAMLRGEFPLSPASAVPLVVMVFGLALLALRAVSFRTCLGFLGTLFMLAISFPRSMGSPWPHSLFVGDLLFAAVFVLSDTRVCARTANGRWLTGILAGCVAFLIRYGASVPGGVYFAVLFANIFAPIIDELVLKAQARGEVAA
jgi:Na+-transporting NADH:ubiquinone oxidoreductase subunit B